MRQEPNSNLGQPQARNSILHFEVAKQTQNTAALSRYIWVFSSILSPNSLINKAVHRFSGRELWSTVRHHVEKLIGGGGIRNHDHEAERL